MDQREQFLADDRRGLYSRAELCASYGIRRKTGYKWFERYHEEGRRGLRDRSHAPHTCPHRIEAAIADLLCAARRKHADWGTPIRRIEAELRGHLVDRPDLQRLVWIPGIGARTAYTLLLEIDDIHRFPSVRHFHSYCRLVPGSQDSGGKTRYKRSKDGNRYLKIAFHHAAIRAVQYFPEIRTVYQDWARRKGTPIARALVAKELAQIVFFVLTKDAPYNDRFASITLTQRKPLTWPRRANPPA